MKRPRSGGFALVVTLMLMILLTIIGVGMLSLSAVSLRTAGQGEAQAVARANARLALMAALGELQKYAGPDQRVTANASILEEPTGTVRKENRNWMGVWRTDGLRAEPATGAKPIIYRVDATSGSDVGSLADRRSEAGYNRGTEVLSWLVSNPNPGVNPDPGVAVSKSIKLVGEGAAANIADHVVAPRVEMKQGAYAWWVADEGSKARFNLPSAPEVATSPPWLNPAQEGIGTMTGLETYESLSDPEMVKSMTRSNGDLAMKTQPGRQSALKPHFHNLSFHSAGVLADTQNGGLRRDLTAFLANGSLAVSGTKPAISLNTPILNSPKLDLISARFGMLKSWNDLAAKVDASGDVEVVPPTAVANGIGSSAVRPGGAGLDLARQTVTPVHPVILDAGISYGASLFKTGAPGTVDGTFQYKLRLHYYPRLVLWNPFQTGIKQTTYAVQFSMPDLFYIHVYDPSIPGGLSKFKFFDAISNSYSAPANNQPLRPVFMVPAVKFSPGEALLFTADASGADRCTLWGDAGGAATSISNLRLSCNKPLPLQDSFMVETQYTIDLPGDSPATATYQIEASGSELSNAKKQYWYKLWQVKGSTGNGSISGLLGNDLINYPPLQYIDQSECGTLASYAPWFVGIPASVTEQLRETKDARNAFYRFKWGHRFQWFADTNENQTVRAGSFNTPYLGYNILANHNLRASWHCWSPVEIFFRASAAAGRYVHGVLIDDPYGWDWTNPMLAPTPVGGRNRVSPFGAPALFGGQVYPILSVPDKNLPLLSLGVFQHVPLSPFFWHPTYAFGNSLADPRGKRQRTTNFVSDAEWQSVGVNAHSWSEFRQAHLNGDMNEQAFLYDLSYEANFALWDTYFLSTIPLNYIPGTSRLPNARIKPLVDTDAVKPDLLNGNRAALRLMVDGAFNVNSTSEEAWAALFATFREDPAIEITLGDGKKVTGNDVFSRLIQPIGTEYAANDATHSATWSGYRKLNDAQILALAREMVSEVKLRGPFVSIADFVNRRLVLPPDGSGESELTKTGLKGALQAAIDRSKLNDTLANAFKIDKTEYHMGGPANELQIQYGTSYPTPYFPLNSGNLRLGPKPDHFHWADSKLVGAPSYLTQADILQKLGPVISARSDTFMIRTYGECRDAAGKVTGRAWAEAIVQRVPQPLVPDATGLDSLTTVAGRFGRRFEIVSFRWLNASEI